MCFFSFYSISQFFRNGFSRVATYRCVAPVIADAVPNNNNKIGNLLLMT